MFVGDRIYELHWYQMSREEQFLVLMVIQRSQMPFELKGLGLFVCSLENYLKVDEISFFVFLTIEPLYVFVKHGHYFIF